MTTDSEHDRDDELLSGLLQTLDEDAAPVDAEFLDGLKARSTAEFSRAAQATVIEELQVNLAATDSVTISSGKDRTMFTLTARLAFSITAACIGGAVWLAAWTGSGEAVGAVTLDEVLRQAVLSETLQLKVVRDGSEADVWVRNFGKQTSDVRWEESPTLYQIASGSRLWEIDEENNTVKSGSRSWLKHDGADQKIDLLAMLGVDDLASRFRKVRAVGQVRHADRDCRVFRMAAKQGDVSLLIEAFADAKTNELLTIAAWPDGLRSEKRAPLAELRLIARNEPVDEAKFVVAKSLSNDGRIGRVLDSQGIVTLRAALRSRWTPIARQMLIRPGDWLRTDVRGANALAITMTSRFRVVAGPGSLIEIQSPRQIQLNGGEVQITGSEHAEEELTLLAPNDQKVVVKAGESGLYRLLADRTLRKIEKKPVWLAGFEGSSNEESIGSLIANIDGRDVPLTVGYHKVSVEIRDQIARTTIEESFVNRTRGRLEGVFHFPLPQDASISGFGMWIGNELVEADVVEKQRAREIYETILRERRDPGLLEWTGGNIFKARVFPIEGHSEKRIKIVYTQVLPLRANQYRYSYALRSELLQKTPLRELSVDVLINSELPLRSVKCPTHSVRSSFGGPVGGGGGPIRSAHLEFAAQEYSPTRDFEVVCEVDTKQSDVNVIPHQRGDDGYFLAQVTLPGADGNWQREVLPDGDPLEVLLVCDTSASMDSDSRQKQGELVAAILSSLGPKDRFNLAVCDVDCHWLFEESVEASVDNEKAITKARQWLSDRTSLGWTDLDKAFASIAERASSGSHVIYIGDGIVTSGDADPQAFASRIDNLFEKKSGSASTDDERQPTFHAISVSSSFESVVLKSIAGVGGGSVRAIGGERTPQTVAFELLNEIAQPGLTDVKVEFRGLQVAAVYPEKLPNLAAGTQQIIVGRYLPHGGDQTGEMIITGNRGGEKVRYAARVRLKGAEAGNSFIPRLWARAHMEQLLQQGTSQFIKDEMIGLSEEFHIITPYTSLLVLESDADRERFGVTRRFEMRDGQRFFADGKDNAKYELLQQQMKHAGDWRIGLRRSILAQLARQGRSTEEMQALKQMVEQRQGLGDVRHLISVTAGVSQFGGYGGLGGGGGFKQERMTRSAGQSRSTASYGFYSGVVGKKLAAFDGDDLDAISANLTGDLNGWDPGREGDVDGDREVILESSDELFDVTHEMSGGRMQSFNAKMELRVSSALSERQAAMKSSSRRSKSDFMSAVSGGRANTRQPYWSGRANGYVDGTQYVNWVSRLFPALPAARVPPKAKVESTWPNAAIEVSRSLLQSEALAGRNRSLEIRSKSETFDARWGGRKMSESSSVELFSTGRWLRSSSALPNQSTVQWGDDEELGVLAKAFLLGRLRKSQPEDLKRTPLAVAPFSQSALHEASAGYDVEVQKQGDRTILLLSVKRQPTSQIRHTIDSRRNVLLSTERLANGDLTSRTVYGPYEKVAGLWWPIGQETFDAKGRRTAVVTNSVKELAAAPFEARFKEELSQRDESQFITETLPSVRKAEVAVADGSAGFEDRLILLLRSSWIQKWDDVLAQLEHLEKLAPNKDGLLWVRASVLKAARRNEDVRQMLLARAEELVKGRPEDYFLAKFVMGEAAGVASQDEQLTILDILRPVCERQAEHVLGLRDWRLRHIEILRQLGRNEEYIALQKVVAENGPWHESSQGQYARDLAGTGDYPAAYQWLRNELDRDVERHEYQIGQLRRVYADILIQEGKTKELVEFLQEWVDAGSENQQLYAEYLSALGMADRVADADELVTKWLTDGRVEGELAGAELAKFNAALSFALGQRHKQTVNFVLPRWLKPLKSTGSFFLRHEHHFTFAKRIMDSYYFQQTDEYDQLIGEVAAILKADADKLSVEDVGSMVNWCLAPSKLTTDDWGVIADTLLRRSKTSEEFEEQRAFGDILVRIYRAKFRDSNLLPFMRQRIARAVDAKEETFAVSYSLALFNELLSREWTEENEVESFALLERLSSAEFAMVRSTSHVEALHRLVDTMLMARFKASMKTLQDEGHPERLTRTELSAKQIEFQKAARTGLSDRLAAEVTKRLAAGDDDDTADKPADGTASVLRDWLMIERMYLDVVLGRNLDEVTTECWTALGESPPTLLTEEQLVEVDGEDVQRRVLEDMLRSRALATLSNLAVRRSVPDGLADRVLQYIDAAIDQEQTTATEDGDQGLTWKTKKFGLLVALDRPDELEVALRKWIGSDEHVAPWQLALGRLLAERARIDEAIPLFETVEKMTPLSASDYQTLSDWYLVADRRSDFERAKVESFQVTQEHVINNWIQQRLYPWQRSDTTLPSELDERVLFAFKALFRKSQHPENYIYQLKYFYQACRDFRLLQVVPDIVIGRTPQRVYSVLKSLQTNLLVEVRDEATADEIIARIKTLQAIAELDVDRRALELLESMLERKSAELLNQPGPHVDAAVAALKRAFEHEWADGETRQMADFLQSLGKITQPKLAAEQMRQLVELHRVAEPGSDDRLFIAYSLARGHFHSYGEREEGIAIMENAIREFDQTHLDGWPLNAAPPLSGYIEFLEEVSRYAQAEKILDVYLQNPSNGPTKNWFLKRQNQVFLQALRKDGRVSLGEGHTLYKKLVARIAEQVPEMDVSYQYTVLSQLVEVFTAANNKHLPKVADDLREFAFNRLPPVLDKMTHQYRTLMDSYARALHDIGGPRHGLEFLMDRVENWPRHLRNGWQDGWSQCGHNMAWWRQQAAGKAADLEPRLLKLVLAELRRELTTRQKRSGYFFRKNYSYFWNAKENEFARVAEEVLSERPDSPRTVNYVTNYLWGELEHFRRAIEIRLVAHEKGGVSEADLYELTQWLHHQKRWAEAIPIMEPLVKSSPNTMKYRTMLLMSYARSSRLEQRDRLLAETNEHFRSGGRWTESNIALLASACVEVKLDEAAVKYYGELIPLAQRTRPNRGIGDGTLSSYYQSLSQSHARLGNTIEAVDAASGAIIAWGPRLDQRRSATSQLKSVIRQAADLSGYVEYLDDQLEESGQNSPLIRRMVGEVFAGKGKHEAAIAQLQLAAELQPFDQETHAALIRSYDALKNSKAAVAQVLEQLDFDRHNLDLYKDLAKRLKGDEQESERAVTTLVESAPEEAEHHETLAVIRQEQNRWGDAIAHWKHVADLRALEPNGLLKLAEAQIHEKRWAAARSTVGKLKAKSWPSRFRNVEGQTQKLETRIKP
ncbi:MAG: VIT domain-containing protein [Planctomycetales bacterium]